MKTKSTLKVFTTVVDGLKSIERVYGSDRYRFYRNYTRLENCDIMSFGVACGHNLITPVVFDDLKELSNNIGKGFFVSCEDGKLLIEFQFIV